MPATDAPGMAATGKLGMLVRATLGTLATGKSVLQSLLQRKDRVHHFTRTIS